VFFHHAFVHNDLKAARAGRARGNRIADPFLHPNDLGPESDGLIHYSRHKFRWPEDKRRVDLDGDLPKTAEKFLPRD